MSGAAIADTPPLTGAGQAPFAVVGQPRPPIGQQRAALRHIVSQGFFDLIGVKLARGRDFNASDTREAPHAIIVRDPGPPGIP